MPLTQRNKCRMSYAMYSTSPERSPSDELLPILENGKTEKNKKKLLCVQKNVLLAAGQGPLGEFVVVEGSLFPRKGANWG